MALTHRGVLKTKNMLQNFDTIIFDLGNVVFGANFSLSFKYWEKVLGFNVAPYFENFRSSTTNVEFEKGNISPEEYYNRIISDLNINISYEDFLTGFNSLYEDAYPDVAEEIKKLVGKVKIAALTNTNVIHNEIWPIRYKDVLKYFDAVYVSSDLHMAKPDPEIYRYVLKDLGTDPNRVLYFDDLEENVDAARELGITSCLVTSPRVVCETLKSLHK